MNCRAGGGKMDRERAEEKRWLDHHPFVFCAISVVVWTIAGCFVHYRLNYFEHVMSAIIVSAFAFCMLFVFYEVFLVLIWGSDTNKRSLTKVRGRLWRLIAFFSIWFVSTIIAIIFLENIWLAFLISVFGVGFLIMIIAVAIISKRDGISFPMPPCC